MPKFSTEFISTLITPAFKYKPPKNVTGRIAYAVMWFSNSPETVFVVAPWMFVFLGVSTSFIQSIPKLIGPKLYSTKTDWKSAVNAPASVVSLVPTSWTSSSSVPSP